MVENVVIFGASPKPTRYAFKAQQMLIEYGHNPLPVSQRGHDILGKKGYHSMLEIKEPVDTVTMYVNAKLHEQHIESILSAKPKRVIFNPGTESPALLKRYQDQGIDAFDACTLVLLRTHQF